MVQNNVIFVVNVRGKPSAAVIIFDITIINSGAINWLILMRSHSYRLKFFLFDNENFCNYTNFVNFSMHKTISKTVGQCVALKFASDRKHITKFLESTLIEVFNIYIYIRS